MVLLARTAQDWLEAQKRADGSVRSLLGDVHIIELDVLARKEVDRASHFQSAMEAFAARLQKPVPQVALPPLEDSRYGRILYVHMAALATLLDKIFTAETVIKQILEHEQHGWRVELEQRMTGKPTTDIDDAMDNVQRAVALITLRGGAGTREDVDRLKFGLSSGLIKLLHWLYPGKDLYVTPLEPDLLGEALVYGALSTTGNAKQTLQALFSDDDQGALQTAFATFARISSDHDDVESWVVAVLEPDVPRRGIMAFFAVLAMAEAGCGDVRMRAVHTRLGAALAMVLERSCTPSRRR